MKFVIYAPSFDEKSGGSIVIHLLCDLLNKYGAEAYISKLLHIKTVKNKQFYFNLSRYKCLWIHEKWLKLKLLFYETFIYKTYPGFNTPSFPFDRVDDDCIVVYPEVISGNPLNAKHVIRWFLNKPGFFTNEINYGPNELYFYYAKHFNCFKLNPNVNHKLTLLWINNRVFKKTNFGERSGTCYMLRKRTDRPIVHGLSDSICLDGRSNEEIAVIMNQCKQFICYDLYTMYSRYAVMCGCESIVVPDPDLSEDAWREENLRHGIAYGFENLEKSRESIPKMFDSLKKQENDMEQEIKNFINISQKFFKLPH